MLRFLFIIAMLGTWFMPLIIAALYKLPHQGSIAVLSLALGWTGLGWLAAFIIAVGGAIRATRPALAGQAQPEGVPAAGAAQVAAMPAVPPQPAWPAATPVPGRAASPGRAPFPERAAFPRAPSPEQPQSPPPPSWPDNPR